jgi:FAD binding domain
MSVGRNRQEGRARQEDRARRAKAAPTPYYGTTAELSLTQKPSNRALEETPGSQRARPKERYRNLQRPFTLAAGTAVHAPIPDIVRSFRTECCKSGRSASATLSRKRCSISMGLSRARSPHSWPRVPISPARIAEEKCRSSIRALIVGGGIGGLAAAVALQRIGMSVRVFEKRPTIAEVGAGLSIWSNAMLALRRLGLESAALSHGSVIERVRSVKSSDAPLAATDFSLLGERAGAPSICIHRGELQRLLFEAVSAGTTSRVETSENASGLPRRLRPSPRSFLMAPAKKATC